MKRMFLAQLTLMFSWLTPPAVAAAPEKSEADFLARIQHVLKVYQPVFQDLRIEVIPEISWKSRTNNAFVHDHTKKRISLRLHGEYYRRKNLTPDGYSLIICHEVGHILGGTPRRKDRGGRILRRNPFSVEGQADYFATLACTKKIWANDDHSGMDFSSLPSHLIGACDANHATAQASAICKRSILASLSVRMAQTEGQGRQTDLSTPSTKKVSTTDPHHPAPQCRLDTTIAGALCPKSPDGHVRKDDAVNGNCDIRFGDQIGLRPACWYAE